MCVCMCACMLACVRVCDCVCMFVHVCVLIHTLLFILHGVQYCVLSQEFFIVYLICISLLTSTECQAVASLVH